MAQVHAKTGSTEPVRHQVRQQSGSGRGLGRAGRGPAPEKNGLAGQGRRGTCPGSAGVSVIPAGLAAPWGRPDGRIGPDCSSVSEQTQLDCPLDGVPLENRIRSGDLYVVADVRRLARTC
jgi:hypothetical protein